ncbi:Alg9-like mannosyltransferase [Plectosphaerella cucumerina]|uniref:Mannosyltransferase n=1 Tax=Plectosphaerella cucumerina TaxID=40658 RepID=A0A8K0T470_9PEZI|nr:Alg9-like mannosyltransferase [Plectosphaerella cucumerina]
MASIGSPTAPAGGPDPQLLKAGRNESKAGTRTAITTTTTMPMPTPMMSKEATPTTVFRLLLALRAFNAYWLCTFFQPDEYFQSLEPAWRMAFGDHAGAWVTWEWTHQLRSSLHPALFAAAYRVADMAARLLPSSLRPTLLLAAPKVVQTVFAAAGDWYTWQLAVKIYGRDSVSSWFALSMSVCSAFHWFVATRTFSNSLEMTLTVMALYYWPWDLFAVATPAAPVKENPRAPPSARAFVLSTSAGLRDLRLSLLLAAVAVTLRPTNLLIWLSVLLSILVAKLSIPGLPITLSTGLILIREITLCGSAVLAASVVSDRLYFGEWTFPPYKFLYFNISQALAVFYGRSPWHYYLSQGLPLLSIAYLPFVLRALFRPPVTESLASNITLTTLAGIARNMITALSLISHKEVRFIYPLLPLLHVLAAPYAASFFTTTAAPTFQEPQPKPKLRNKGYLQAALALNLLLAGFLSIFHQPAPLTVLTHLRREFERIHPDAAAALPPFPNSSLSTDNELFALFLTPCHSTPWRSHLIHPHLTARALTCEPPLHTAPNTVERETYRDEADRFYDAPLDFLANELWPTAGNPTPGAPPKLTDERIPRFIVGFEGIEPWLRDFFLDHPRASKLGLRPVRVWEGWNGLFNEDSRRAGKLVVWNTGLYLYTSPPSKGEVIACLAE